MLGLGSGWGTPRGHSVLRPLCNPRPPHPPPHAPHSVLKRIPFRRPADTFVLLHLQRRHLPEWVRAMAAVALGVGPSGALPPVILQEPADHQLATMSERRARAGFAPAQAEAARARAAAARARFAPCVCRRAPLRRVSLAAPAPAPSAAMPLEGVPPNEWVVFERVLIVRDVFTGGSRTFASAADAHEFRAAVYAHYGAPLRARGF